MRMQHHALRPCPCRLRSPRLACAGLRAGIEQVPPPRLKWSFAGPFGKYDEAQLQRGFKIYREVCSNCHSMDLVAFRSLADPGGPGFSEAQAEAGRRRVQDQGPRRQGQADRARRPAGRSFPGAVPQRARRPRRPMAASRRPTCRRWPRRAATSAASPGSSSTSSRSTRSRGPTTSRRSSTASRIRRQGLQAAAERPLQRIFPRPQHRHAAAAAGRAGEI